jgi:4-amino-4-deoxychorismate lyase
MAPSNNEREQPIEYPEPPTFELFTSLRYDPILMGSEENNMLSFTTSCPFYMLVYHQRRLLEAARHFGFTEAAKVLEAEDGLAFQNHLTKEVESYENAQAMQGKLRGKPLKVRWLRLTWKMSLMMIVFS